MKRTTMVDTIPTTVIQGKVRLNQIYVISRSSHHITIEIDFATKRPELFSYGFGTWRWNAEGNRITPATVELVLYFSCNEATLNADVNNPREQTEVQITLPGYMQDWIMTDSGDIRYGWVMTLSHRKSTYRDEDFLYSINQ